jgi:hypothetical protein
MFYERKCCAILGVGWSSSCDTVNIGLGLHTTRALHNKPAYVLQLMQYPLWALGKFLNFKPSLLEYKILLYLNSFCVYVDSSGQ